MKAAADGKSQALLARCPPPPPPRLCQLGPLSGVHESHMPRWQKRSSLI